MAPAASGGTNMKAKLHLTPELKKAVDEYVEEKIREFLSRSNRSIKIINITQYGASDGIYTTIWFGYLN